MALPDGLATAEDSGTPSQLFFQHRSEVCRCIVVRKVDSGAVLCIPRNGISEEVFHEAEELGYAGVIGPFMETSAQAMNADGTISRRLLEVMLFDLDATGFDGVLDSLPPGTDEAVRHNFGVHRGRPEWPHASSVATLRKEFIRVGGDRLDVYFTAEEAEASTRPPGAPTAAAPAAASPVANGVDPTQELLNQLLNQNQSTQAMVSGLQGQFEQLGSRLSNLEQKQPGFRAPAAGGRDAPQLFDPAPRGLTEEKMSALKQLAERGPGKLGDLGATGRAAPLAPVVPLGGIDEEGEVDDDIDGEFLEAAPNASTLERLLASQHTLLSQLVKSRVQHNDPLSILSSSAQEDPDHPKGSGVKGIAARQLLQEQFKKHPRRVTALVRERLATARRKSSSAELEPRDMRYHFQESVPLGTHKTLTHVAFIAASMFESMERQQSDRLQMLCLLLAVFVEQAAVDGGSLRLAHLLTGLEDPPFSATELHKAARADLPHGSLADPRWITTQLQYLKDVDNIQERSGKYGRPSNPRSSESTEDAAAAAKAKPKWRPKKGKRSQEGGSEEG